MSVQKGDEMETHHPHNPQNPADRRPRPSPQQQAGESDQSPEPRAYRFTDWAAI